MRLLPGYSTASSLSAGSDPPAVALSVMQTQTYGSWTSNSGAENGGRRRRIERPAEVLLP